MTVLELILKALGSAAGNVANLKATLQSVVQRFPDTAGELAPIIDALDAVVSPESLAALGAAIPGELLNIVQGKLDPRPHSGDSI